MFSHIQFFIKVLKVLPSDFPELDFLWSRPSVLVPVEDPLSFWPHRTPAGVFKKSQIFKSIMSKIENLDMCKIFFWQITSKKLSLCSWKITNRPFSRGSNFFIFQPQGFENLGLMQNTPRGSSMSFYPDFILILSWFYPDFI